MSGVTPGQAAFLREEKRHLDELLKILGKHPEERMTFVYGVLGYAVAIADRLDVDVEAWLAELRRREPKPDVLVPPRRGMS
jgi:hypothetical protein